jgi:phage anti-repressor protein
VNNQHIQPTLHVVSTDNEENTSSELVESSISALNAVTTDSLGEMTILASIVKLHDNHGKFKVNMREIYNYLGVNSDFSHWVKRGISRRGLIENKDFLINREFPQNREIAKNPKGAGPSSIEYYATTEAAKLITMLANTTKEANEIYRYLSKCDEIVMDSLMDESKRINSLPKSEIFKLAYESHLRAEIAEASLESANITIDEQVTVINEQIEFIDAHVHFHKYIRSDQYVNGDYLLRMKILNNHLPELASSERVTLVLSYYNCGKGLYRNAKNMDIEVFKTTDVIDIREMFLEDLEFISISNSGLTNIYRHPALPNMELRIKI